jgi:23S rRNA (cytidine2498-2'-O)-methyltransferase
MEISRDQTVVDLGSAPGSWSWVCLELGAKVISVDRSELSPDVMKRKKVTYIPGDAFSYFPEEPVDWLISDIIAYPDRIISMLQTWLKKGLMRNFCVTLKFKGDERGKAIESLREVLKDTQCLIRHMENNKNEITAVGSCSFSA